MPLEDVARAFERENEIREVMQHDAGGRGYEGRYSTSRNILSQPNDVQVPPAWASIMRQVLELAPPEPSSAADLERRRSFAVAGVIDSRHRGMQPALSTLPEVNVDGGRGSRGATSSASVHSRESGMDPNQLQAMFAKIGAAAPTNNYGQYVRAGRHDLGVLKYEFKTTQDGKQILAAEFVVLATTPAPGARPHAVGEVVTVHWRMSGLTGWKADKEMSRAQGFVTATLEAAGLIAQKNATEPPVVLANGQQIGAGAAWLQQEGFKAIGPDQPLRGRIVTAIGTVHSGKQQQGPVDPNKEAFVIVDFQPSPGVNAPEAIAQRRAQFDAQHGPYVPSAPQAAAPSYGHAVQAAPPPAPPPGYQQQVAPAPATAPYGYAQPQGYGPPGGVPGYAQPPAYPQGNPPGVPAYSQQVAQPAPAYQQPVAQAPAVAPGNFLPRQG